MSNKIELPKKYKNEHGNYPEFLGEFKLSYSQHNSWITPEYRPDYINQYFLKQKGESNVWADFGSDTGTFIEITGTNKDYSKFEPVIMSQDYDREFLLSLNYPENSVYEDEIVLPVKDSKGNILFVIQGFIDRAIYSNNNKDVEITDFKTGNLVKKAKYYGSDEYGQTTLYAHCKALEGYNIVGSNVLLLGRKGNGHTGHPIRLSGDSKLIDTPYTKERGDSVVKAMTKTAKEISDYYKVFKKLNK